MVHGKLEAIWLKTAKRGAMQAVPDAALVAGKGIRDNADFGGKRQVTIIEKEIWELLAEQMGEDVDPAARRANLMISGVELKDSVSRILRIGDCRIRIQGETKPCTQMDQAVFGLRGKMELMWRGGAWGEVLDAGQIRIGDGVRWES